MRRPDLLGLYHSSPLGIDIADHAGQSFQMLWTTLAHEMIHLALQLQAKGARPEKDDHGPKFKRAQAKVARMFSGPLIDI